MNRKPKEDLMLNKMSIRLTGLSKSLMTKGVTLNLLKMNSTNRKDFFMKNSFSNEELEMSKGEELRLINDKILFKIDEARGLLTLTIKGIILFEYGLDGEDERIAEFLNDLNDNYFQDLMVKNNEPLESQEKAVVLTLLGLHAFTSETAIKLSAYNESIQNVNLFKGCVDDALSYIRGLGERYFDSKMDKIWSLNVIGENPVVARISRLNNISIKTDQIYKKEGGNHFLDVLKDGRLSKDKVTYLLRKIFDKGTLNFEEREALVSLMKSIQSNRYKLINTSHDFDNADIGYGLHRIIEEFKTV